MCCLPFMELSPSFTCLEFNSVCFSFMDLILLRKIQVLWLNPPQVCLLAASFSRLRSVFKHWFEVAAFRVRTQHVALKACPQPSAVQGQQLLKPPHQMDGEERHASLLSAALGWMRR